MTLCRKGKGKIEFLCQCRRCDKRMSCFTSNFSICKCGCMDAGVDKWAIRSCIVEYRAEPKLQPWNQNPALKLFSFSFIYSSTNQPDNVRKEQLVKFLCSDADILEGRELTNLFFFSHVALVSVMSYPQLSPTFCLFVICTHLNLLGSNQ